MTIAIYLGCKVVKHQKISLVHVLHLGDIADSEFFLGSDSLDR